MDETTNTDIWEQYFTIPNIRADLYLLRLIRKGGDWNDIFLSYKIVYRELGTSEINSLQLVVALNYKFDALVSSSLDVANPCK
jgi:hypothetical protein